MATKTILVFGASGAQGGSVVDWLLRDPNSPFRVRAATRDPNKPAVQALVTKHGRARIELVRADLDDEASLDAAFKGVYGAFGVTNFWEHQDGAKETAQGCRLADAAKRARVEHYVWSTGSSVTEMSGGKRVHAANCDSKARVDDHIRKIGYVDRTTFFIAPLYYENISSLTPPMKQPDGTYIATFPISPTAPMPQYSVTDTGGFVLGIFNAGKDATDTYVIGKARDYSYADLCANVSRATGFEVKFVESSNDQFIALMKQVTGNEAAGRAMVDSFRCWEEFGYALADTASERSFWAGEKKPVLHEEWVKTQDWTFLKE